MAPPAPLEPTASWTVSRFLLRFPSFSVRILAKSRPLRQTLFASSATGGASQALPPTSPLSFKRVSDNQNHALNAWYALALQGHNTGLCLKAH